MFHRPAERVLTALSIAIAAAVLAAAGMGISYPDIYRPMTPDALLPGTLSQDIISLCAALGLVATLYYAHRRRQTAWLIWLGLVGYLFYAYALYAFEGVYNGLYLAYLFIAGASVYALISFFFCLDKDSVRYRHGAKPPRRALAVLFVLFVVMFVGLWMSILVPAMATHEAPAGGTIFVLDLGFILPLLGIEAVLLWRSARFGDILALPLVIKLATLGLSVLIGTLLGPVFGLPIAWEEVMVYAVLGIGPLIFVPFFLKGIEIG